MATFSKVSHISFSVRDSETSARWWAELLDLTEIDRVSGDGWQGVLLLHPTSRTVIEFQQHDGKPSIRGAPGSITWASKSTHVPI
jgi:glyoxylase I family protein